MKILIPIVLKTTCICRFCSVLFSSISTTFSITARFLTLHWTTDECPELHPDESYASSIARAIKTNSTVVNIFSVLLCFLAFHFTGGLTGFHL